MQAFVVTYETRDPLGRIVEEIDSIFVSNTRASRRRREINNDPVTYPGMVADSREFPIADFALSVTPPPNSYPGSGRKLTTEKVIAMREMREADESVSLRDLANAFGVSYQTASDVVNRRTWRHV